MANLTSNSLLNCNSIPDFIATGTPMMFEQTAAPTSWTKSTTHDNKALRVVSGTATPGGTNPFTSINNNPEGASITIPSTGSSSLSSTQISSHSHGSRATGPWVLDAVSAQFNGGANPSLTFRYFQGNVSVTVESNGSGGSHTHPSASAPGNFIFDVLYVDIIIATKD